MFAQKTSVIVCNAEIKRLAKHPFIHFIVHNSPIIQEIEEALVSTRIGTGVAYGQSLIQTRQTIGDRCMKRLHLDSYFVAMGGLTNIRRDGDFLVEIVGNILYPIGSMYGIFTYIYNKFMINVGKYSIHGSYGYGTGVKRM